MWIKNIMGRFANFIVSERGMNFLAIVGGIAILTTMWWLCGFLPVLIGSLGGLLYSIISRL